MSAARDCELQCFGAHLGYDRAGSATLLEALTHRSYCAENPGTCSNERLEFLGDSVLGLFITEALYRSLPDMSEGELAKLRASLVNAGALARVASGIGLGAHLRLGKGEDQSGGRTKESILADGLEAVIGAVYVDQGVERARALIEDLFAPAIAAEVERGAGGHDFKTRLQELAAQRFERQPTYVIAESGPDHGKQFHATVVIERQALGSGAGTSKKRAEQAAAEAAWFALTGGDDAGAAGS